MCQIAEVRGRARDGADGLRVVSQATTREAGAAHQGTLDSECFGVLLC